MKVFICIFFYIITGMFSVVSHELEKDGIVAFVNDQIILNSDINKVLFFLEKNSKGFKTPFKESFLKEQIIQRLIIDSLILQEADKMNIIITEEQVNNIIKNIALKRKITISELKHYIMLNDINNHEAYQNYIDNIKKSLKIKIVQDYELHKRINISDYEVNNFFRKIIKENTRLKRFNLSYILIPYNKQDSNSTFRQKEILATNTLQKLKNGYNFQKFYIEQKKNNGPFLVKNNFWIRFKNIHKILHNIPKITEKGQILGPYLEKKGFYIIKINDISDNKENIITQFYVQHCFLKSSFNIKDRELKNNILNIFENIKKKKYSFDDAVKKLSNDFYSSRKNGDIGWISKELFNNDFYSTLLNLQKNEISKPMKSNFGWHIVKILNKREIDLFYNFKKKQAYNILLGKKMILEKDKWIKELRDLSYIKIIN